jgi:hypothetical protein
MGTTGSGGIEVCFSILLVGKVKGGLGGWMGG